MRYYHLDLREVVRSGMGARRFRALIQGLPPDAALIRAMVAQYDPATLAGPDLPAVATTPPVDGVLTRPIAVEDQGERPGRRFARGVMRLDREMREARTRR